MIKEYRDFIIVGFVTLSVVMYDVTLDLLLTLLHIIFEVLHMDFEWFELGIEHAVQHIFHTSHHGSQIVTFYILLLIGCGIGFWLWRTLPSLYKQCIHSLRQSCLELSSKLKCYWLSITLSRKIRLWFTGFSVVYMTYLFLM